MILSWRGAEHRYLQLQLRCSNNSGCAPKHSLRATNLGAIVAGLLPVTEWKKLQQRCCCCLLQLQTLFLASLFSCSSHYTTKTWKKKPCTTADHFPFSDRKTTSSSFALQKTVSLSCHYFAWRVFWWTADRTFFPPHGVWKSHSTLRAKRAMFTFWVDKSSLKMPKMVHFDEFSKT